MKAGLPGRRMEERLEKVTLVGDHYAIGCQLGRGLRELPREEPTWGRLRFAGSCREALAQIYPPLIEKAEGLIEGGKLDRDQFNVLYFTRRVPMQACAGLAVSGENTEARTPIVGRNYQWSYEARQWCELREVRVAGGFSTLGYTHHWSSSPDILNDKGLFLRISSLAASGHRAPGLQWHMVMDMVSETCATTKEAVTLICSLPHLGSFGYLVADSDGELAVAEATPDGVRVRRPVRGFIVVTNHRVGTEEEHLALDPGSVAAYRRITEMVQRHLPHVSEEAVKRILADHESPICVGPHETCHLDNDGGYGTIYALVCRPRLRTLSIAPGHPCRTPYQEVRLRQKAGARPASRGSGAPVHAVSRPSECRSG